MVLMEGKRKRGRLKGHGSDCKEKDLNGIGAVGGMCKVEQVRGEHLIKKEVRDTYEPCIVLMRNGSSISITLIQLSILTKHLKFTANLSHRCHA